MDGAGLAEELRSVLRNRRTWTLHQPVCRVSTFPPLHHLPSQLSDMTVNYTFPTELFDKIFKYLKPGDTEDKKTLLHVQLACHRLRDVAFKHAHTHALLKGK